MTQGTIEYFRGRAVAERDAVRNASCDEARVVHEQLAAAYARLVEIEELKAGGALAPGQVMSLAEALRARDDAMYGARAQLLPGVTATPARLI
jgi:hypothetical protein